MKKTNAERMLESAKIPFEAKEYPVDENDLSGEHLAETIGVPPEEVFKTLVLKGEKNGYAVCCIPANAELDLKKVAQAAGEKKIEMIPMKDLLAVTGYIRGGCSPVGMKKKFPTFFDETATLFSHVHISGGVRGLCLLVETQKIVDYTDATIADLTK